MTVTNSQLWAILEDQASSLPDTPALFAKDPDRAEKFTFPLDDEFFIDLSKNIIDKNILSVLIDFAKERHILQKREAMFAGYPINTTENRSVLHTALRGHENDIFTINGDDVMKDVISTRRRMTTFTDKVRAGTWKGATGKTIKTVINIGIGGSALGPELVTRALRNFHDGPEVRFLANVDPADTARVLDSLDPATTLVVVASKTFTTQETMANATALRHWLTSALGENAVAKHFVAASTNTEAVTAFGIDASNMFPFSEWVGGRFSLWSSIGLPIMLAIGATQFERLLDGARDMDEHFRHAPPEENLPILMALTGIWNRNFLHFPTLAILPYAQDLALLPAFLQQLEMESNGKQVHMDGSPVCLPTCPVVFGQPGTNGQHAFHQQIHQGPEVIPCDFIIALTPHPKDNAIAPGQHRLLVANALAQSAALLSGRRHENPHRYFSGNRPSTMIVMKQLTPRNLGRLIALYEHKVAVQGWFWDVNSFDQFGVELGKEMAKSLLDPSGDMMATFDGSTRALFALLNEETGNNNNT